MDSTQLNRLQQGFSSWHPFNKQSVGKAPKQYGAYVIRKARGQQFGRLKGKSDILYIGSAEARGGLKKRIGGYFYPGRTQWTNLRIRELAKKYKMEIAWCQCATKHEAGNLEHKLLNQYLREHDELPPLNRAGKMLLRLVLTDSFRHTDRLDQVLSPGKP